MALTCAELLSLPNDLMNEQDGNSQSFEDVSASLQPMRQRLVGHPVFHAIGTLEDLQVFMEHHVFAVWDFMALLKALQQRLTCVAFPWLPTAEVASRRLINEIVLEEESDEFEQGVYGSHFEFYHQAMKQCGANTAPIDRFIDLLRQGETVHEALTKAAVPAAAMHFVRSTWAVLESESPYRIAAAFTFGREDLIPDMFRTIIANLEGLWPHRLGIFRRYLERHVHLDEEHHSPMAIRMLRSLCQDDVGRWKEVEATAKFALSARLALWNAVNRQLDRVRNTDVLGVA
jgi:Protein of unknown function (DUF3050)